MRITSGIFAAGAEVGRTRLEAKSPAPTAPVRASISRRVIEEDWVSGFMGLEFLVDEKVLEPRLHPAGAIGRALEEFVRRRDVGDLHRLRVPMDHLTGADGQ